MHNLLKTKPSESYIYYFHFLLFSGKNTKTKIVIIIFTRDKFEVINQPLITLGV